MYAIIKAGGKQYTVKPGDVLRVEKLEAELGATLDLKEVLMVGGEKTFVSDLGNAVVTVVVTNQERGPKIVVFKKKRRQGYRRMGGHRQPYTELFVKSITNPDGKTLNAENKPNVFNPEKKAARLAKTNEVREQWKQKNRAAAKAGDAPSVAAPAKKKSAAKKAAPKKAAGAKKKVAKKKSAAKKPATKAKRSKK